MSILGTDVAFRPMRFQNPFWRQSDRPVCFQIEDDSFFLKTTLFYVRQLT